MISIKKSTTPTYLKNSEFYNSLQDDDDDDDDEDDVQDEKGYIMTIPIETCKFDETINSQEDLMHLCRTIRYWGEHEIPEVIYETAFGPIHFDWSVVVEEFGAELTFLQAIVHTLLTPISERLKVAACTHGLLSLVIFLHKHGYEAPQNICPLVAQAGHVHILEYFHKQGSPLAFEMAASITVVLGQYVSSSCGSSEVVTCDFAARAGHLDCLQYAHENGCSWGARTCTSAAVEGHLDCLKYAHEHGCSWDKAVCSYAARSGHLSCLQYAHVNGCPWDLVTSIYAAEFGHLECLQYAQ